MRFSESTNSRKQWKIQFLILCYFLFFFQQVSIISRNMTDFDSYIPFKVSPTRRRAYVPAYFANPVHCSRLNGRPSVSFLPLLRNAVTQCSVSSRPVYITRHLSQLFVSGDIDSFLRLRASQLKLSYLLSRYRILRPSFFTVMLECSGSANTHKRVPVPRDISSSMSRLMRFVCFCFERRTLSTRG